MKISAGYPCSQPIQQEQWPFYLFFFLAAYKKRSKFPFLDSANRRVTQPLEPVLNSLPPTPESGTGRGGIAGQRGPDPSHPPELSGKGLNCPLETPTSHHNLPRAAKPPASLA